MTWPKTLALLLVAALLAGCAQPQESRGGAGGAGDDAGAGRDGADDVQVRVGEVTRPQPDAEVGPNQTFSVAGPLVRVHARVAADGPWTLRVLDAQGDDVDEMLSGEGAYDGARWLALPAGEYQLALDGEGAWNATVASNARDRAAPVTWEGRGDDGTTGVRLARGAATFNLTGEGDVRAWILDPQGRTVVSLMGRDGSGDDATITVGEAGVYVVNVESESIWQVRVTT